MMKEVAVILYYAGYDGYGYEESMLAQSISNWQYVTDEDFELLKMFVPRLAKGDLTYVLVEKYPDVNKLLEEHLDACRKLKVVSDEAKAKAAMTKQQKEEAKLAKEREKAYELARKHGLL